jgi:hypothetical protein
VCVELSLIAGASVLTELSIRYTDPDEQPQEVQLAVVDKNCGQQSMLWLTALQKVSRKPYLSLKKFDCDFIVKLLVKRTTKCNVKSWKGMLASVCSYIVTRSCVMS